MLDGEFAFSIYPELPVQVFSYEKAHGTKTRGKFESGIVFGGQVTFPILYVKYRIMFFCLVSCVSKRLAKMKKPPNFLLSSRAF
jgi:hypothetical protein